jgi:hypothetical protein
VGVQKIEMKDLAAVAKLVTKLTKPKKRLPLTPMMLDALE